MKNAKVLSAAAVCSVVLGAAAVAEAGTVFVSSLSGAGERPVPVSTPATGKAVMELTGSEGSYVLTYTINYANLGSEPVGGHIHYSIIEPGQTPTDQVGPIVEELDDFPTNPPTTSGTIRGDWRYDDDTKPLTDALVDSLFDGELYVNLHTAEFPTGEIRGQLVQGGTATPIPLPAPLIPGLLGLGAVGMTVVRAGRRRRA